MIKDVLCTPPQRIIRGSEAENGEFPYQVYLKNYRTRLFCGGSIISSKHILTAAHCVKNNKYLNNLYIYIGSVNLWRNGLYYNVQSVNIHPKYIGSSTGRVTKNDIAILTVSIFRL